MFDAVTREDMDASAPLANLRDLGGIKVKGGRIRTGTLWRSDDICLAPQAQIRELAAQGLEAVIDLRSYEELARTGRGATTPLAHHHLPMTDGDADPAAISKMLTTINTPSDVGRWYAEVLLERSAVLVSVLRIVAASEGGILFHCAAGKDRTGIVAASILACLGASDEDIVSDYAVTHANIDAILRRLDSNGHGKSGRESLHADHPRHPLLEAHSENMWEMLRILGSQGGIQKMLTPAGYDATLNAALRDRLVDGHS
jgi:protein-tyrosine phosphatase